ncbi:hypothetical protein JCM8547_001091 [Rhodosporidiobolus lusitaniae]
MSRVASSPKATQTPTSTNLDEEGDTVAIPRAQPAPAAVDDPVDEEETPAPTTVETPSPALLPVQAPLPTTATITTDSPREMSTTIKETPLTTTSSLPRTSASPPRARPTSLESSTLEEPSSDPLALVKTVIAPLSLPTSLLTSPLPLSLALPTLIPADVPISPSSVVTILPTSASTLGFATTVRRPPHLPSNGFPLPSPTSSTARPAETLSPAEQRANSTGVISGISLAALVAVLLLLVAAPQIKACLFRQKRDDEDVINPWTMSKNVVVRAQKDKDDDEISWFSGSTTDGLGEKAEKGSPHGRVMMVEHSSERDLPLQHNLAGIGRRNTLRSIRSGASSPPGPDFASFPSCPPTIVYSLPPPEPEATFPFVPPRRTLTPQSFPSTPTSQVFPSSPLRSANTLPFSTPGKADVHGYYPPSTPPLGSLYTQDQWQHILSSPPIRSPASTKTLSSSAASTAPLRHPRAPSSVYDDTDDLAYPVATYDSRLPHRHEPPSPQRPPRPHLPIRLEGLAAAAQRSASYRSESFPITLSTEFGEDTVVAGGVGWKKVR